MFWKVRHGGYKIWSNTINKIYTNQFVCTSILWYIRPWGDTTLTQTLAKTTSAFHYLPKLYPNPNPNPHFGGIKMAYQKSEKERGRERKELGFGNPNPMYPKPKPKGRGTKLVKPFGFLPKPKGEPDVTLRVLYLPHSSSIYF